MVEASLEAGIVLPEELRRSEIEERVAWWAEVFEIPCVGYAASLDEIAALVAAGADFVALGDFLWRDPQAIAATIRDAARYLQPAETTA